MTVDNGQHVFLGCCTEYIRLLGRLGVGDSVHLQKRFRVPIIDKTWGASILRADDLPPPFHLLRSVLRFRSLSVQDRSLAGWALMQIMLTDRASAGLDDITFQDWLLSRRQSRRAIRSLWNLIILPTLNTDISQASADLAMMVFQEGFLRSRHGANVGWARLGLSDLISNAAKTYITARGGEVRTGCGIRSVDVESGQVAGVHTETGPLTADVYVLALPQGEVLALLPTQVRGDPFFSRIARLISSPIVNVHLWYDRPVWHRAFAAFVNSPVQWIFNKSRLWGQQDSGQYLDISLSGADDFVDAPSSDLIELFTKELFALLPATRGAELSRALVVKQRSATFAAIPGVAKLRPAQRTPLGNLFLAGDWTDTGWPATMESAVRSGIFAGRAAALSRLRSHETATA